MIVELFSRSSLIGSKIIRAMEWGEWSHNAYLDPATNLVIEATWPEGVRAVPFDEWLREGHKIAHCAVVRPERPLIVWTHAASQIGRPYDKTGVLGLGIHRDWQKDDAWFCSELCEWADHQAGVGHYKPEAIRRVGVRDRWILSR